MVNFYFFIFARWRHACCIQEAKELGTVSRPWRRGYSVPNLSLNGVISNSSTIQRPSGEELMNLRLRKVKHDDLFERLLSVWYAWPSCMTERGKNEKMERAKEKEA